MSAFLRTLHVLPRISKSALRQLCTALLLMGLLSSLVAAHEQTRPTSTVPVNPVAGGVDDDPSHETASSTPAACRLTLELTLDGDGCAGLVRLTNLQTGESLDLDDQIHRKQGWHTIDVRTALDVPATKLRIEALHGIETELTSLKIDLADRDQAHLKLPLKRLDDPRQRGLVSGNTHLHLMDMRYQAALRYLELVPRADGLDLVFLSHLRRFPDERRYVSNQIVEQSLSDPAAGPLARLSVRKIVYRPGEEHRHNFGRSGEGFGHVMLLDIRQLIRPVSIGPGIMGQGTDSVPLQRGIRAALRDEATVVWCHAAYGLEDVANWLAGLVHAQNIFDGGSSGNYERSFYRYLNLGLSVPFSTGTDWFVYDFSRAYVPVQGELNSADWLRELAKGRSFITNGPLLEFSVAGQGAGDTIDLAEPRTLTVMGRGIGRLDFGALELVKNGMVVERVASRRQEGHYTAEMETKVKIDRPSWLALRTPTGAVINELDNPLFAHTSPIYVTIGGRRIFQRDIAQALIAEIKESMLKIDASATFADDQQRAGVLQVYQQAMATLHERLREESHVRRQHGDKPTGEKRE